MKVALVYPRTKKDVYSSWAPRGFVSLSTLLVKNTTHDVFVIDSSFNKDLKNTKKHLLNIKPDVVSLSISSDLMNNAKELINFSKKIGAITVVGGPYAILEPEKIFSEISCVDYVITGDSEFVFPKILEALEENKTPIDIKGVYYRKEKKIVFTGEADFYQELNSLPFPDYSLLSTTEKYFRFGTATIIGCLGCPFRCNFCQPTLNRLFGNKVRFRSPKNVIEEISYLKKKYDIKEIYFVDDTFGLDKKWLKRLVSLLEKKDLTNIKFLVNTRVNVLNEEFSKLLKRMNCYLVSVGVESGSQKILDNLNKDINVQQIIKAFNLCKKYGLTTHANLMIGNPGETKETLKQTKNLLQKIKPNFLYLSFLTPYPGTYLYEESLRNGNLNLDSYNDFNCRKYNKPKLPIKNMDVDYEYLNAYRKTILRRRKLIVFYYFIKLIWSDFQESFKEKAFNKFFIKQLMRARTYFRTKSYFG